MIAKLPETLFKHKHTKFPIVAGYSGDGLLIFTTAERAKKYSLTFSDSEFSELEGAFEPISKQELLSQLISLSTTHNPAGQHLTIAFNLEKKGDGTLNFRNIYRIQEFLAIVKREKEFCNAGDYEGSDFKGLLELYDYQGELTGLLDSKSGLDFNQETINEIVLWKVNRYVSTRTENDWLSMLNAFKNDKELEEDKLREFLKCVLQDSVRGIRLAMASTFLRFRNPEVYQIIDERMYRVVLRKEAHKKMLADYTRPADQMELYIDYLWKLKQLCSEKDIIFRDADRILYQFDIVKNGDFNTK